MDPGVLTWAVKRSERFFVPGLVSKEWGVRLLKRYPLLSEKKKWGANHKKKGVCKVLPVVDFVKALFAGDIF